MRFFAFFLSISFASLLGSVAQADEAAPPAAPGPAAEPAAEGDGSWSSRTLRGHTFSIPVLPVNSQTAFVTTHFGLRQEGTLDRAGGLTIGARTVSTTVLSIVQAFDLGIAFTDRIGIDVRLAGQANLGVDAPSLYLRGAGGIFHGDLGVVYRVARSEKHGYQFAIRAEGGASAGTLTPFVRFKQVVDESLGGTLAAVIAGNLLSRLVVPSARLRAGVSFHAAYAFSPIFSLQGNIVARFEDRQVGLTDIVTGQTVTTSAPSVVLGAGVAFAVDGVSQGVPLAALAEYSASNDPTPLLDTTDASKRVTHALGLGVFFTGVRHLQLGLSASTTLGLRPLQITDDTGQTLETAAPTDARFRFLFRYIW